AFAAFAFAVTHDADAKATIFALVGGRSRAGRREHAFEDCATGGRERRCRKRTQADRGDRTHDGAARTFAGAHSLLVAEVLAVRKTEERVRSTHDARVDRGHEERRGPAPELRVPLGAHALVAIGTAFTRVRIEPIRIARELAHARILRGIFHDGEHR